MSAAETAPVERPRVRLGALGWLRANLFSSPLNTLLTIGALYLLWLTVPPLLNWAVFNATISGTDKSACAGASGACWTFVKMRFGQFIYGLYPVDERWRVNVVFAVGAVLVFAALSPRIPGKLWSGAAFVFVFPVLAFVMLYGGLGLPVVETRLWGGLMLTLVIAVTGIVVSLPLGIVLALARRSRMPVVKAVAVVFIEVIRGVPLITILFMASVMFPLFLPAGMNFDKLVRALVGVAIFSSAYMAEVIRGGLQAIPKGQIEAAQALGLDYKRTMGLIVLPQALKLVIPGIVNSFISLFKDTTLVYIIGLFDLLGIVQAASTNAEWLGTTIEGYAFSAVVFGGFCLAMSRYSQALERRLETGHRRR
jgi:general L-amino acid transport system permease protein